MDIILRVLIGVPVVLFIMMLVAIAFLALLECIFRKY